MTPPPNGSATTLRSDASGAVITVIHGHHIVLIVERRRPTVQDELDRFMTALEDLGILTGWKDFKEQEAKEQEATNIDP